MSGPNLRGEGSEVNLYLFALCCFSCSLKLTQESNVVGSNVVGEQVTDVGDLMADHTQTFDAQSKCKSGDFVWIVSDRLEHVWINHSGATELDPFSIPVVIRFHAWFGEREERRPNPNWNFIAQVITRK